MVQFPHPWCLCDIPRKMNLVRERWPLRWLDWGVRAMVLRPRIVIRRASDTLKTLMAELHGLAALSLLRTTGARACRDGAVRVLVNDMTVRNNSARVPDYGDFGTMSNFLFLVSHATWRTSFHDFMKRGLRDHTTSKPAHRLSGARECQWSKEVGLVEGFSRLHLV